jgi:hypothetical protein
MSPLVKGYIWAGSVLQWMLHGGPWIAQGRHFFGEFAAFLEPF